MGKVSEGITLCSSSRQSRMVETTLDNDSASPGSGWPLDNGMSCWSYRTAACILSPVLVRRAETQSPPGPERLFLSGTRIVGSSNVWNAFSPFPRGICGSSPSAQGTGTGPELQPLQLTAGQRPRKAAGLADDNAMAGKKRRPEPGLAQSLP